MCILTKFVRHISETSGTRVSKEYTNETFVDTDICWYRFSADGVQTDQSISVVEYTLRADVCTHATCNMHIHVQAHFPGRHLKHQRCSPNSSVCTQYCLRLCVRFVDLMFAAFGNIICIRILIACVPGRVRAVADCAGSSRTIHLIIIYQIQHMLAGSGGAVCTRIRVEYSKICFNDIGHMLAINGE